MYALALCCQMGNTHTQTRPGSAWMRDSFRTRLLKLSNECVDQNDDDVIIVCVI